MKSQTPSTKLQISILNNQNKKQFWNFEFGHCDLFDICDLEFLILQYSKTARHLYQRSH
jgi:hypothetical protein